MSWTGGHTEAMILAHENVQQCESSENMTRLASALYTQANRLMADAVATLKRCRFLLTVRCLRQAIDNASQALVWADRVWHSPRRLDSDQVDVLCSIWLRYGWLWGGQRAKVKVILRTIDIKEMSMELHTRAFLLCHRLDIGLCARKNRERSIERICQLANQASKQANSDLQKLAQAGRIHRAAARQIRRSSLTGRLFGCDRSRGHLDAARILFERVGATDQLAKMGMGP